MPNQILPRSAYHLQFRVCHALLPLPPPPPHQHQTVDQPTGAREWIGPQRLAAVPHSANICVFVLQLRYCSLLVCSGFVCLIALCSCVRAACFFCRTSGLWLPCADPSRSPALLLHCSEGRGGLDHGAGLTGGEDKGLLHQLETWFIFFLSLRRPSGSRR